MVATSKKRYLKTFGSGITLMRHLVLRSVFLFADLTTAKAFWANQDHYQSYIYSVRLAEDAQPFLAEMELLRTDGLPYSDILERAHAYWQQKQQPESMSLEAICTGTVLVEELILPPSSIL